MSKTVTPTHILIFKMFISTLMGNRKHPTFLGISVRHSNPSLRCSFQPSCSGVGSTGAPGAGAPPLFIRAPADLASFPGRFVGGGRGKTQQSMPGHFSSSHKLAWERVDYIQ